MSPAHPPVKCFFSKDMNVYLSYGRIFEAEFALKSRGFGDSAVLPVKIKV